MNPDPFLRDDGVGCPYSVLTSARLRELDIAWWTNSVTEARPWFPGLANI